MNKKINASNQKPEPLNFKMLHIPVTFVFVTVVLIFIIRSDYFYCKKSLVECELRLAKNLSGRGTSNSKKVTINTSTKEETSKTSYKEKDEKYLKLDQSLNFTKLVQVNYEGKPALTAYIFDDKEIVLPALLSDYDHILEINRYADQGTSIGGITFSQVSFGESETYSTSKLKGYIYASADGKYRASLTPNLEDAGLLGTGYQVVASSKEKFDELLDIAENYEVSDYLGYYNHGGDMLPKIIKKQPNYTDVRLPYTYYVPAGHTRSESLNSGYPNVYFKNQKDEIICLSFKEDQNDPCLFSTSGCTCCNTGCVLVDYVTYASRDGIIQINPVLQKGAGLNASMGARFLYRSPHPWLYYTAYFSSPENNARGALDLIYLLDSMERNY
jgi:hypothetical protein